MPPLNIALDLQSTTLHTIAMTTTLNIGDARIVPSPYHAGQVELHAWDYVGNKPAWVYVDLFTTIDAAQAHVLAMDPEATCTVDMAAV